MKYKKIIIAALILAIVVVNGFTVFWLVRGSEKPAEEIGGQHIVGIFGMPDKITVIRDGKSKEVTGKKYDDILALAEKSRKYVETFTDIGTFSDGDELMVEFTYNDPYKFSHGYLEYDVSSIKIDLYNGSGNLLLQTTDGAVCLGYLNITAEFINAVK